MSFSNTSGGTLALPSPTHAHHMDVTSAVRSLRRSISRSPSKFLSRTSSQSSDGSQQPSPSHKSPRRPSISTPQLRTLAHDQTPFHIRSAPPAVASMNCSTPHRLPSQTSDPQSHPQWQRTSQSQSLTLTPFRPSTKLSLRSAKSSKTSTPSRQPARQRASPKSPLKRPLFNTSDSGNASQLSTTPPTACFPGQENNTAASPSPATRNSVDKSSRHSFHLDVSGAAHSNFLKSLDAGSDSYMVTTTGALKRSDATMNLDQPDQGSPMAKRRSLHGVSSLGQTDDLSIFGPNAAALYGFDIHEDVNQDYGLAGASVAMQQGSTDATGQSQTPNVPKRTSSLRRSTLQQRYGEKTSLSRRTGERQLAQMNAETSTPPRIRPRLSTDQFMPPSDSRDASFTLGSPLPLATLPQPETKLHHPHPLSKTLTTSSSGGSLTEEDHGYVSQKLVEKPKIHPFSRSLPVNSNRPQGHSGNDLPKLIATPNHTSHLWIAAFNSTGLVSKVNRNPEEEADKKIAPPDTPCKKHSNPFATFPPPSGSAVKKMGKNRNSFGGLASTPFNASTMQAPEPLSNPGKGLSIFQRGSALRNTRRGSILSLEGDERKLFSDAGDLPISFDGDAPPTPTKHLTPSVSNLSEQSLESPSAHRTIDVPLSAVRPPLSRESTCKSKTGQAPELLKTPNDEIPQSVGQFVVFDSGPPVDVRPCLPLSGRSEASCDFQSPTAHPPKPLPLPLSKSKKAFAKISFVHSASPVNRRSTPQTPQEGLFPLDTRRLSFFHPNEGSGEAAMPPPATPTTEKDFKSSTSIFVTPVNGRSSNTDCDASLYSLFDKVEQIGKGEFSMVYRVTKFNRRPSSNAGSVATESGRTASPSHGAVYAVKKSKAAYIGNRDRDSKLREVHILQALSQAEHVVQFVDSWENNFHLYIQTEFCEEGTLDKFLGNIGRSGRLDDFRIFKVLLDLSLGLKEIHDAGFVHLDIKPANILITFEGAMKIADFGLAQPCPVAGGVDIEGDREYMAPEVLKGKADRSADVFSLGLITLEVAANVVLPDNGPTWIALRSGDLSEVPSLTWAPSEVHKDGTDEPVVSGHSDILHATGPHEASNLFGSFKRSELQQPPEFMANAYHPSSLDSIVRWMTTQEPGRRPVAGQILELEGVKWVAEHRNAPATIYEGNWGPSEIFPVSLPIDCDTEMTGV